MANHRGALRSTDSAGAWAARRARLLCQGLGRRVRSYVLVSLLISVGAGSSAAQVVSDGDFINDRWSHFILWSNANPTATLDFTMQVAAGGNPGAWQDGKHTTNGASSGIYDGHLFVGGGYNPSVQGAIDGVTISYDIKNFDHGSGIGVQSGLLVSQGGTNYILAVHSTGVLNWTHASRTGTASTLGPFGWKKIDFSGVFDNFAPDFSASGTAMRFGYYTFSWSLTQGFFTEREWGIDNFSIAMLAPLGVDDAAPNAFALWQNQPNPFRASTVIRYSLPSAAPVTLEVFGPRGERVATLVRKEQQPGRYTVSFTPASMSSTHRSLASGIYFYRFRAGSFASTRKMLILQ